MRRLFKYCLPVPVLSLVLQVVIGAQTPDPSPGKGHPPGPDFPPPEEQGERRGPPGPPRGPRPGPEFPFPSFEMLSSRKVVKGAPYSATAITETVQTLADGAKITNKRTDTVYRDN